MPTPTVFLPAFQVNTGSAANNDQSSPSAIGLSDGRILVAWVEEQSASVSISAGFNVVGQILDAEGAPQGAPFGLTSTTGAGDEFFFDIAATNDGGFAIAYASLDVSGDTSQILYDRYDSAGALVHGASLDTESDAGFDFSFPTINVNQTNNAITVVYERPFNFGAGLNDRDVFGVTIADDGTTTGPFNAGRNTSGDEDFQDSAVLSNGNIVTVFETTSSTSSSGTQLRIVDASGAIVTSAVTIPSADNIGKVAALAGGGFVVLAFRDSTDLVADIFDNSGALISSVSTGFSVPGAPDLFGLDVIALPDGGYAVAFSDDVTFEVEVAAYNADGTPDGGGFATQFTNFFGVGAHLLGVTSDGRLLTAAIDLTTEEIFLEILDSRGSTIDMADLNRGNAATLDTNAVVGRIAGTTILGTSDDDTITGRGNADSIDGGLGNDTLDGGSGDDTLRGGGDDDVLLGGFGSDTFDGGSGTDTVNIADSEVFGFAFDINLDTGSDGFGNVYASIEHVIGGTEGDTIIGSGADETLEGRSGNDTLDGGAGNDTIQGGEGGDVLYGGDDIDTLSYADSGNDVAVNLGFGSFFGGDADGDSAFDFENLIGSAFDDRLGGDAQDNTIEGLAGNDILDDSAGVDAHFGGFGDDSFQIIEGVNAVGEVYDGGGDFDAINLFGKGASQFDLSDDTVSDIEIIRFIGNQGTDPNTRGGATLQLDAAAFDVGGIQEIEDQSASGAVVVVEVDASNQATTDLSGVTLLGFGTAGSGLTITGDGDSENITGTGEDDSIIGNGGSDSIFGGAGNDTIDGSAGFATLDGGAGTADAFSFQNATGPAFATFSGTTGFEILIGSNFNDTLFALNNSSETVFGGGGDDLVVGFSGRDELFGGAGNDSIETSLKDDDIGEVLDGGADRDTLLVLGRNFVSSTPVVDLRDDQLVSLEVLELEVQIDNTDLTTQINFAQIGSAGIDTVVFERRFADRTNNSATLQIFADTETTVDLSALNFSIVQDLTSSVEIIGDSDFENLFDSAFSDTVRGEGGGDLIVLTGGIDTAFGGTGDDLLVVDGNFNDAGELYDGGADDDLLAVGYDSGTLTAATVDLRDDTLSSIEGLLLDTQVAGVQLTAQVGVDQLTSAGVTSLDNNVFGAGSTHVYELFLDNTTDFDLSSFGGSTTNLALQDRLTFVVEGDGDAETIEGSLLNDVLIGNAGGDTLDGSDGTDTASYENSTLGVNIRLDTGSASGGDADGDELISIENVTGSQQTDTITGDSGDNVLIGLDGNDQLNGRAGNDTLDGGLGNDRFFVDSVDDVVIEAAGEGTDLITTSVDFTLAENVENASSSGSADIEITGNAGANFMSGNGGDNRLVGLAGADRLRGGDGNDTLEGGEDNDILEGQGGADRFVMTANNGDDQIIGWEATTDVLDFETLGLRFADLRLTSSGNEALITFDDPAGGTGSVRLIDIDPEVLEIGIMSDPGGVGSGLGAPGGIPLVAGTSASENLAGSAAGDDLIGLAGSDTLNGRAGDDTMLGGFGDDRYLLDDAGDIALELEFQGIDQVDTRFDLVLGANIERAAVRGGGAVDITGNELDNFITGSELTNVLIGGDGRDRLIARAGNDTLDGGLDRDVLEGGAGEDVFVFGADSDVDLITDFVVGEDLIDVSALGIAFADMTIVDGALGALVIFDAAPGSVDLVTLQGVSAADVRLASFIGAPNLPIVGTENDDVLRGTVEDDVLQGLGGADQVDGQAGADTLIGGDGDDRYFVDDAGDVVIEFAGEGTDLVSSLVDFTLPEHVENGSALGTGDVDLTGNAVANALTGNDASNVLTGLEGDDNLQGKAGADTIDGGAGFDVLRGGADADVFRFAPGDGATGDQIIDFDVGVDTIDLSATGLGFGDLTIVDVGANANVTYGMNTLTVFNTTAAELDSGQFDFGA